MVRDSSGALFAEGRSSVSAANQKDLLMFEHLANAAYAGVDWFCRIETDAYFSAPNFLHFLDKKNLSAEDPYFLGSISYWHIHFEPRIITNEQVQCLSKGGVQRLAEVVRKAPVVQEACYLQCELAPGHRGDLMLAVCLAEANVTPYGDMMDERGKEYFINFRMEDLGRYNPKLIGNESGDPRAFDTDASMHWKSKGHIFLPCLKHNQNWASSHPVCFHDYKDPQQIRWVHEVMLGRQTCEQCPKGYLPATAARDKR